MNKSGRIFSTMDFFPSSLRRGLACVLAWIFLFPGLAWTFAPGVPAGVQAGIWLSGKPLRLPPRTGWIQSYLPGGARTIIYLQDLHGNEEVQKNIVRILGYLAREHGLRLVGEEGAFYTVDVSQIRDFPDAPARAAVCDYLVQQGKLSGAEYYAGLANAPPLLVGIDEPGLYDASESEVRRFLSAEAQGLCADLRDGLAQAKRALYNSSLTTLDAGREAYGRGSLDLSAYARRLVGLAKARKMDMRFFSRLTAYIQDGELSSENLFQELDLLEQRIRETMYTLPVQKELDNFSRRVEILEKLLNISANSDELRKVRQNRDLFRAVEFLRFMRKIFPETEIRDWGALDGWVDRALRFYQLADRRSRVFVENLKRSMDAGRATLAAMVVGGFHSQGILAELRRQGIACLTLRPRISRLRAPNPYFSLLQGQETPLETWLAQTSGSLALRTRFPQERPDGNRVWTKTSRIFSKLLQHYFSRVSIAKGIWKKSPSQQTVVPEIQRLAQQNHLNLDAARLAQLGRDLGHALGRIVPIPGQDGWVTLAARSTLPAAGVPEKIGEEYYYTIDPRQSERLAQILEAAKHPSAAPSRSEPGFRLEEESNSLDALPDRDAPLEPTIREVLDYVSSDFYPSGIERSDLERYIRVFKIPKWEISTAPELPGTGTGFNQIGPYELLWEFSKPGVSRPSEASKVYAARDARTFTETVLKFQPDASAPKGMQLDFLAEYLMYEERLQGISGIPGFRALGYYADPAGEPRFVLATGRSHEITLAQVRGVSPGDIMTIAKAVVKIVGDLHAVGVLHRDLKFGNILLPRPGEFAHPQIIDFESAVVCSDRAKMQFACRTAKVTEGFLAPECRPESGGKLLFSRQSDMYALGVIFRVLTEEGTLENSDTKNKMLELFYRMAEYDPNRRPASAGEILDRLEEIMPGRNREDRVLHLEPHQAPEFVQEGKFPPKFRQGGWVGLPAQGLLQGSRAALRGLASFSKRSWAGGKKQGMKFRSSRRLGQAA